MKHKYKYIKRSAIKALAKSKGKRVSEQFLFILDAYIGNKISIACETHNGGRKTLKGDLAVMIGLASRF
jgi:hypothetical protein